MESEVAELKKKIEMMEMLAKSADVVMNRGVFEDNDNQAVTGGGLGGELNDFEDMDGSFNAGDNGTFNQSSQQESRRGTFMMDLNQSVNSDNQELHNKLLELQQQHI